MKLREIMTSPVLSSTPREPASDAFARMRDAGVRHAVVLSDGAVVGVVSDRDLGGPLGGAVRKGKSVGDLMQREPVVAPPELGVARAALLVRKHRIGCVPVVEEGELVGIVTRSDLLAALAKKRRRDRQREGRPRDTADVPRPPRVVSPNRDKWP